MVNSADAHGICDPLHRFESLGPAISAEGFTDGISLLLLIQVRTGARHLGKSPVVKGRIVIIKGGPEISFRFSRINVIDHVDSCCVHSIHGTEIVAGAIAKPCVGAVFLHHMADQPDLMGSAPVSELSDKILLKSSGNRIHVCIAYIRCFLAAVKPERRKITLHVSHAIVGKLCKQRL